METLTQRAEFKLGLIFISVAVLFWGLLPIALKLSGLFIDPVTLTWFRFLVALIVSFAIQYLSGSIKQFKALDKRSWLKMSLAGILLIFNYVSFVFSLKYLAPGSAQLNFQTAPFFLAFGGMLFFKERLNAMQLSCFATLALGMLMFFHPYIGLSTSPDSADVWKGVLIVQFSVLSWASYALIQKSMIKRLSPNNILLFIYLFGIFAMAPFSDFTQFAVMDKNQWAIAIFCAINTVIAYGCFGQSMKYWPTGQVSAMLALTPVISFTLTAIVVSLGWWSDLIKGAIIDPLSFAGIVLIIVSVIIVQLSPIWQKRRALKHAAAT
ncbi:DMT family transporter [Shewanella fidelis]|uniref:DMT family transporter n=1 Tax=Shewanella fidelis TaxID=173509 RepID=A0AAW8NPV9_9GAMM|nr:DMT family transporter [Shewanella fidelis]MDR8525239.1 DMT family transporter [Shewanella fidelis]MDW4811310.1 DMT family transporter [Shewanella fidelis]MDW4814911.1 DMT family transporter [Shewanella fidelis]MDW4819001.1 DMT family transporter [Shewanella fidelis]MDW4823322.1 DMT family transporter [Shewanella fidelis]